MKYQINYLELSRRVRDYVMNIFIQCYNWSIGFRRVRGSSTTNLAE